MKDADQGMIPDALSHRELSGLLQTAPREAVACTPEVDPLADDLRNWAEQTRHLLQRISAHGEAVGQHRSPQQVMALGSCRTHMMLSLQALRAAQS